MGGRGSSSGKNSKSGASSGGKGKATQSNKKKIGEESKATQSKNRTYTKPSTPVSKMSDAQLKKELVKVAKVYYASGKSGISFGGANTDLAAEALGSRKMGRSMMERQYRSMLKKMK